MRAADLCTFCARFHAWRKGASCTRYLERCVQCACESEKRGRQLGRKQSMHQERDFSIHVIEPEGYETRLARVERIRTHQHPTGLDPGLVLPTSFAPFVVVTASGCVRVSASAPRLFHGAGLPVPQAARALVLQLVNTSHDLPSLVSVSFCPHAVADVTRSLEILLCQPPAPAPQAVRTLLGAFADPNLRAGDGTTPLHEAATRRNLSLCQALISSGADINAPLLRQTPRSISGLRPSQVR